jgi:hypothetical protein
MARSTPQVRDLTAPTRTYDLGENTQDRTVQGPVTQRVAELLRVGGRSSVVALAGGSEGIVFDHARDSSSWRRGEPGESRSPALSLILDAVGDLQVGKVWQSRRNG